MIGCIGHKVDVTLALVIVMFLVSGCGSDTNPGEPVPCTPEYVAGILVEVLDDETENPAACGATVWLVDDEYSEECDYFCAIELPEWLRSPWVSGAYERPGVYTVTVVKEGYNSWSRSGVVVTANECHVERVILRARLIR